MERDPAQIEEDSRLAEDLEADSLDLVELAMILEEELSVEISDDELSQIATVGDAVEVIAIHMGATE